MTRTDINGRGSIIKLGGPCHGGKLETLDWSCHSNSPLPWPSSQTPSCWRSPAGRPQIRRPTASRRYALSLRPPLVFSWILEAFISSSAIVISFISSYLRSESVLAIAWFLFSWLLFGRAVSSFSQNLHLVAWTHNEVVISRNRVFLILIRTQFRMLCRMWFSCFIQETVFWLLNGCFVLLIVIFNNARSRTRSYLFWLYNTKSSALTSYVYEVGEVIWEIHANAKIEIFEGDKWLNYLLCFNDMPKL